MTSEEQTSEVPLPKKEVEVEQVQTSTKKSTSPEPNQENKNLLSQSNEAINIENKEQNTDDNQSIKSNENKEIEEPKQVTKNTLLGVIIVYFSVFLDFMILPFFAEKFNASSTQLGGLYSSYAGMSLIATYMMGKMSDKYGRKISILYSLFGTCVGYILSGLAWNYNSFLVTRLISGAFGGSAPVAQAYVSDVIPKKSRPQYLAMVGAVMAMAFIIGPGIGSGLGELGIRVPFFVAGGMGGVGFLFAIVWLEESNPKILEARKKKNDDLEAVSTNVSDDDDNNDKNIIDPIAKEVYYLFVVFFIAFLGWTAYTSMYALYMLDKFGLGSLEVGFTTLVLALVLVVTNVLGFNKTNEKFGLYYTCCIGFVLQGMGLAFCTLYDNKWYNLAFMVFFVGSGNGLVMPATTAMLAEYSTLTNRGKVMAFGNSASNLSFVVGPMLHGVFFGIRKSLPFLVGGGLSITSLVLLFIMMIKYPETRRKKDDKTHKSVKSSDWEFVREEPSDSEYLRLGRDVGKLLTDRNYLWVKYYDKCMELFSHTFLPLRISSLEDHISDVMFISESQKNMEEQYKLLGHGIDLKFS